MHHQINTNRHDRARTGSERVAEALKSLPVGRERPELAAEIFIANLLTRLPIEPHKRLEILPGSDPSLLNAFQLLAHVGHEVRMGFFRSVIERAISLGSSSQSSKKELPFLAAILVQAGYYLNPIERRKLLLEVSRTKPSGAVARCWVALARSAKKIEEAHRILEACGRDKLLAFGSRELKEFIVAVEIISDFGMIKMPSKPPLHVTGQHVLTLKQQQLGEVLNSAKKVLDQAAWAKGTTRYARFKAMLKASEKVVSSIAESEGAPGERNKLLRANLDRIALELEFGKSFPEDASRPWKEKELRVVRAALEETGKFRNICSPIFEIKRVAEIEDACGHILTCGTRIELEDRCFAAGKAAHAVRGGCSPEEVVIHELGHSFSMVPLDTIWNRIHKLGGVNINEWFVSDHFPAIFLKLGRWGGVVKDFEINEASVVTINGKHVSLGAPVKIDGEVRVYQYDQGRKCLYWYEYPLGEFPRRPDSRADPTEQLTEGFSDYYRAPEELIEHAPNLFWYFESIYHRYEKDPNILDRLSSRLKSKTVVVPRQVPAEVDAFSLLLRNEQLALLDKIGQTRKRWQSKMPSAQERELVFLRAWSRGYRQRAISRMLQETLAQYNPAFLIARSCLLKGHDVVVASIRGTRNAELPDAQDIFRKELAMVLGANFDRRNVFLLGDAKKSARYQTPLYHQKLVTLITERLSGVAARANGQHKFLHQGYERVILYTDMFPTADFVRKFAHQRKISDKIEVRSPGSITPYEAAKEYLASQPGEGDRETLHVFTSDEILSLPARFHVRSREGGRPMRSLALNEFLLHPDPAYWLGVVVRQNPGYRKSDVVFDDSEFTAEEALLQFLKEGREDALMLKRRVAGSVH